MSTTGPWTIYQAFASTFLVTVAAPFALLLIPLDRSRRRLPVLKFLLAFSCGGLLGDVFLHMVPRVLLTVSGGGSGAAKNVTSDEAVAETHGHGHGHGHGHREGLSDTMWHDLGVGISLLLGILAFISVEKGLRILITPVNEEVPKKKKARKGKGKNKKKGRAGQKRVQVRDPEFPEIRLGGYLNLVSEFTYSYADGLLIGGSFYAGTSIGIATTCTILLRQIPHRIGTLSILIQSRCSNGKAIKLQFTTAIAAFSGTAMAITMASKGLADVASIWILPFTAGQFIYVAAVIMIPELLTSTTFKQSLCNVVGLLGGVFLMFWIA